MAISLDKIEQKAPELLSLSKNANHTLKSKGLEGHRAKVALCLDFSMSMTNHYNSGAMQRLAEKVLAFGSQIDDDGAIDIFIFGREAEYLGELTIDNFRDGLAKLLGNRRKTSTAYHAAFDLIRDHYFPTKKGLGGLFGKTATPNAPLSTPAELPVHVTFLTDGSPDSRKLAQESLVKASFVPIFWQFLSIGSEEFPFLVKLDDLKTRYVDNADYKPVGDVDKLTSTELYNALLDEYPEYIQVQRANRQIR